MHHIFHISELIAHVLSYLQDKKATLSCVAQTCGFLKVVSLPILWRDLSSIVPLLQLLPKDAVTIQPLDGEWFVAVTRNISAQEWKRFEFYAPFIRSLVDAQDIVGSYLPVLEDYALYRQSSRQERALLPKLTHIMWCPSKAEELRVLFHLLSNQLQSLQVQFVWGRTNATFLEPDDDELRFTEIADYVGLAKEIMLVAPQLAHLTFPNLTDHWAPAVAERVANAVAGVIRAQPALRRLDMDFGPFVYLTHKFPPLDSLVELRLKSSIRTTDLKPMKAISLLALKKICADFRPNIQDVWASLLAMSGNTIQDIDVHTVASLVGVAELFTVIGGSCRSLRSLVLTGTFVWDPTLTGKLLLPLLCCAELAHLDLRGRRPNCDLSLSVHDDDMEAMAMAWPKLEVIILGIEFPWNSVLKPSLSLRSLHRLCVHCPQLRSVQLTMNTIPVPVTPIQLSPSNYRPLKSLNFGYSTIEDPRAIAEWLGDACLAKGITAHRERRGTEPEGLLWAEVRNAVALRQKA